MHSSAGGAAFDATVDIGTNLSPSAERELRDQQHATATHEAEKAVTAIEGKVAGIDLAALDDSDAAARKLEGMRQSLAAAREELARLRAEDGDN